MKKYFYTAMFALSLTVVGAQTTTPTPAPAVNSTDREAEFDRKWRFGLRVTPQPTWFSSTDKNNPPAGAAFGFGFGLNVERRLSQVAGILFGIGGDFEGAKYSFRNDGANQYTPVYFINNSSGEFVTPKDNGKGDGTELFNDKNTAYYLKERRVKTTHVTLPVILKLSTKEYSGMKYFVNFGTEIGIRVKHVANDSYLSSQTYSSNGLPLPAKENPESIENINLGNSEGSLAPLRIGLNVGGGFEYRLGGTTALFVSANYFRSFTNQMRNESNVMFYNYTVEGGTNSYQYVKQNYILQAIRINIGLMF
ncbi:MAG: outer membrane beta-barrel protein [Bacteroidota bacterium]|jgi:hypothetical protein